MDDRQYRSDQACNDNGVGGGQLLDVAACVELTNPSRTMLGEAQERWLLRGLERAHARWTVIGQQTLFAAFDGKPEEGEFVWSDGWSGYKPARDRIVNTLRDHSVPNPIIIGGDMHSFWTTDVRSGSGRDLKEPVVATEFVGTSISSSGPPPERFEPLLPENPQIRLFEARKRGYALCEVTPKQWRTDFRVITDVADPASPASVLASFVVEDGHPGAQRA